jgi:resolvase-like protein/helix-turn-helix resolvase-like protein
LPQSLVMLNPYPHPGPSFSTLSVLHFFISAAATDDSRITRSRTPLDARASRPCCRERRRPGCGTNSSSPLAAVPNRRADTTTPHGELMITILAGLATFERHLTRARTDEGRKRAQARGVKFGRKPKLSAFQIKEALARREAGEPLVEIGRTYGVSHSTISRL